MNCRNSLKCLLMGDEGVGKTSLQKVYMHNFGLKHHDHRYDGQRYQIEVMEVLTFNQLHQYHLYENERDMIINVLCFNVTERKSLATLRREWIPELLTINKKCKLFLMGLQCDLREQFLTRLTQKCFNFEDGIQMCLYYENLYYVECSNLKLASVKEAFDKILEIFLYADIQRQMEERIIRLYTTMNIKFEFYGKINWINQHDEVDTVDNSHPDEESFL
ncbi:cdc42 homolog [Haematobia irritans]|uniref:cdc42 homolog n=1 Tax=Haematobia irritans TaxID=7368 RepID=UPI003F4FF12C